MKRFNINSDYMMEEICQLACEYQLFRLYFLFDDQHLYQLKIQQTSIHNNYFQLVYNLRTVKIVLQ